MRREELIKKLKKERDRLSKSDIYKILWQRDKNDDKYIPCGVKDIIKNENSLSSYWFGYWQGRYHSLIDLLDHVIMLMERDKKSLQKALLEYLSWRG